MSGSGQVQFPQWLLHVVQTGHFGAQRQRTQAPHWEAARRFVFGHIGEHAFDLLLHLIIDTFDAVLDDIGCSCCGRRGCPCDVYRFAAMIETSRGTCRTHGTFSAIFANTTTTFDRAGVAGQFRATMALLRVCIAARFRDIFYLLTWHRSKRNESKRFPLLLVLYFRMHFHAEL